ncbi:MAG: FecR domain-containing protein [Holophagales bacterium]|nr:FecR domain-containing protein [Holophagales bacterium]
MTIRASWFALLIASLLPATTAAAQRQGYSYLSWVGPEVSLVSNAEDDSSARLNTPILAGDRIATGPTSRAEAILADGNILRIDVQTNLRFDRLAKTYEAEDERNALVVERGAVSLEHRWTTSRDEATRIDTDDVTIVFPDKGLLRVETGRRGTEIYVISGQAEVYARSGRASLKAGQYAFATGDAELEIDWLDEPRDRFTRFVGERRSLGGSGSGLRYVSAEYDYDYAASGLDRYGSWVLVNGSYCWRPTVAPEWRPYTDGYWRWSPAGLTWVSYEPWGWLPYHYGSWDWSLSLGWYWSPGSYYSPAWVYWTYTPSWVGWCPIGYYGGYYGGEYGGHHGGGHAGGPEGYPGSRRHRQGAERGTHAYPHLRGPVDVTRIDPRGWSYTSSTKIGSRLDSRRDVLRQERVGFRPGERGLVATTPLYIDRGRGGSATTAVQEAVRRVPQTLGAEPRGGRGLEDLTPVLRREGTLGTTTRESLRRAFVTPGQDPAYRSVSADQMAAPRRDPAAGTTARGPSREGSRGFGSSSTPARGEERAVPGRDTGATPREAWRNGGIAETRPGRSTDAAPRRDAETSLGGGFGRDRDIRSDDGWRSPGSDTRSGATPSRTLDVPARRSIATPENPDPGQRTVRRESAPESEPWRSTVESPTRRQLPSQPDGGTTSPGRREAPGLRGDEGWRGTDAPARSSEAPRSAPRTDEAPPSRSYEAPSRSSDAPRSAPAPRSEAPPARSYEPPARSSEPPSRSYDAPRSAPAPRSEAPPSRSYDAPRSAPAPRSYEAPTRSDSAPTFHPSSPSTPSSPPSSDAPSRSSSPRG